MDKNKALIEILDLAQKVFSYKLFVRVIYIFLFITFFMIFLTFIFVAIDGFKEFLKVFKYRKVKDESGEGLLSSYSSLVIVNLLSSFMILIVSYKLMVYFIAGIKDPAGIGFNSLILLEETFNNKATLFIIIVSLFLGNTFQVDIMDIEDRLIPFMNYMYLKDSVVIADYEPYELRFGNKVKVFKVMPEKEIARHFFIKDISFSITILLFLIFASADIVVLLQKSYVNHEFISTAYFIVVILFLDLFFLFENDLLEDSLMTTEEMFKFQITPSYSGQELQLELDNYQEEIKTIQNEFMQSMFNAVEEYYDDNEEHMDDKDKEDDDEA